MSKIYGKIVGHSHTVTKEDFEKTKIRDNIKTEYASKNDIKLVRIPYRNNEDQKNVIPILESIMI